MFNKKHLALLASAGSLSLAGMATAQADTLEDTIERGASQHRMTTVTGKAWTLMFAAQ